MIDIANIPSNVQKLALGCFIGEHIGPDELLVITPENAISVAANCGLTIREYAEALIWIGDYQLRHGEALKQYVQQRRRASN